MFLIFPRSMMIPEILEHLEDSDFEDWLTAALIENATSGSIPDQRANGTHSPPRLKPNLRREDARNAMRATDSIAPFRVIACTNRGFVMGWHDMRHLKSWAWIQL
jgi:hypothetical protein